MVEKFLCVCRKRGLRTQELHFLIIGLHMTGTAVAGCKVRRFSCSAAAALFNAVAEANALVSTQAADRLPAIF
ncbi:hypothetical protein DXU03_04960 [Rhizobium johnstonii]